MKAAIRLANLQRFPLEWLERAAVVAGERGYSRAGRLLAGAACRFALRARVPGTVGTWAWIMWAPPSEDPDCVEVEYFGAAWAAEVWLRLSSSGCYDCSIGPMPTSPEEWATWHQAHRSWCTDALLIDEPPLDDSPIPF